MGKPPGTRPITSWLLAHPRLGVPSPDLLPLIHHRRPRVAPVLTTPMSCFDQGIVVQIQSFHIRISGAFMFPHFFSSTFILPSVRPDSRIDGQQPTRRRGQFNSLNGYTIEGVRFFKAIRQPRPASLRIAWNSQGKSDDLSGHFPRFAVLRDLPCTFQIDLPEHASSYWSQRPRHERCPAPHPLEQGDVLETGGVATALLRHLETVFNRRTVGAPL